ncbi:MAG: chemotaxis protein CheW [Spirochaetes bacterium]|nr:chemotaxis protein CheW [Spirochaetota bacterium]
MRDTKYKKKEQLLLADYDDNQKREKHSDKNPFAFVQNYTDMQIVEVVPITNQDMILKIPDVPEYILGLFYHHDSLIPIIDTGINYCEHINEKGQDCFVAILEVQDTTIGFLLNSVDELIQLSKTKINIVIN